MMVKTPSSVPSGNDMQLIPAMTMLKILDLRCAILLPDMMVQIPSAQPQIIPQPPSPTKSQPTAGGGPAAVGAGPVRAKPDGRDV